MISENYCIFAPKVKAMKRTMIYLGALAFALMMLNTSCGKKQHIEISKTAMIYSYSGGEDVFRVEADCGWEVIGMPDWITVEPVSGSGNGNVVVRVQRNNSLIDRNHLLYVTSETGKTKKSIQIVQMKPDISAIVNKVWFTLSDERWDTDYFDQIIPESYRSYNYYADDEYEHWFFYFTNEHDGYQVRTYDGDTTNYPFSFTYYPDVDSLDISFEVEGDTLVEDYHTIVHQLDNEFFVFSHAYRPHQYEKITTANVTGEEKAIFKINPKKNQAKPRGPLIPVK